jgi:hypothetical protein
MQGADPKVARSSFQVPLRAIGHRHGRSKIATSLTPRSPRQHGASSCSMSRPILPESAYEALGLGSETIRILMTPKPPDEPDIAAPNLLQSDEDNAQPMEPNETLITLYAELLLHIRTITLFASLRTHHSRETTAKLSSDGTCITVSHEGRSASIRMPFEVKGGGDAEMTLPSEPPSKDITLRLQLEELEDSDVLGALQSEERKVNVVPWDGASLDRHSDLEVRCKGCQGTVVSRGKITQWRDLPNENWAEMMDFWHCHKPDEHHLHDHTHENAIDAKGYAAGNRLQAAEGLGFVDLTSFLLREEDCAGAQVGHNVSSSAACFLKCFHSASGRKEGDLATSMALSSIQAPKSNMLIHVPSASDVSSSLLGRWIAVAVG